MSDQLLKILDFTESLNLPEGDYLKVCNALKKAFETHTNNRILNFRIYPNADESNYLEIINHTRTGRIEGFYSYKVYENKKYKKYTSNRSIYSLIKEYLMVHHSIKAKIKTPLTQKVYLYQPTLLEDKIEEAIEDEYWNFEDEEEDLDGGNQEAYSGIIAGRFQRLVYL